MVAISNILKVILFVFVLLIVIYGLIVLNIVPGFDNIFNIFGTWSAKLFKPI